MGTLICFWETLSGLGHILASGRALLDFLIDELRLQGGEKQTKSGSQTDGTMDFDDSLMLIDDTLYHGKPHAGSFSNIFGREKGIKDFFHGLCFHTATCVTDRYLKKGPGEQLLYWAGISAAVSSVLFN